MAIERSSEWLSYTAACGLSEGEDVNAMRDATYSAIDVLSNAREDADGNEGGWECRSKPSVTSLSVCLSCHSCRQYDRSRYEVPRVICQQDGRMAWI